MTAREKGMTDDEARAHSDRICGTTSDDIAFQDLSGLKRGQWWTARTVLTLQRLRDAVSDGATARADGTKRQAHDDALEKYAELSSYRPYISQLLAEHGHWRAGAKQKLIEVYWDLVRAGAGRRVGRAFVPALAIYDPRLLRAILQAEAEGLDASQLAKRAITVSTHLVRVTRLQTGGEFVIQNVSAAMIVAGLGVAIMGFLLVDIGLSFGIGVAISVGTVIGVPLKYLLVAATASVLIGLFLVISRATRRAQ